MASLILTALTYDSTWSYRTAFLVITAIGVLGAFLLLGIPKAPSSEELNASS